MIKLLLLPIVMLSIIGCHSKKVPTEKPVEVKTSHPAKSANTSIDTIAEIMNQLFSGQHVVSNDSSAHKEDAESGRFLKRHVHWTPNSSESEILGFLSESGSVYTLIDTIIIEDSLHFLAVLGTYPEKSSFDYPISVPSVGIAECEISPAGIVVLSSKKHIVHAGSAGHLPDFSSVSLGKQGIGLMYEDYVLGQGLTQITSKIIGRSGDNFDTLISVLTESDNSGVYEEGSDSIWSMISEVTWQNEKSGVPSMIVHHFGTEPDSTEAISKSDYKDVFKWNGRRFENANN